MGPHLKRLTVAAVFTVAVAPSLANSYRTIGWEDLLPKKMQELEQEAEALQRKIDGLPPAQRRIYDEVALELTARESIESGRFTREELNPESVAVLDRKPAESNPDAVAFWQRVREMKSLFEAQDGSIRTSINGDTVKIPGYLLPLEFEEGQVSEFLLVPYVGACIHVPPPPANQMVYVKASEAVSSGMYTPVWVEGRIFAKPAQYNLNLVDGQSPVDAGYSLEAVKVEPYSE